MKPKESPINSTMHSKEQHYKSHFDLKVKDNQIKAGTFHLNNTSCKSQLSINHPETQEQQDKSEKIDDTSDKTSEKTDDTSSAKSSSKNLTSDDFTDNLQNVGKNDSSEEISLNIDGSDAVVPEPQTISDSSLGAGSGSSASFGGSYGSIQWGIVRGGGRYNLRSQKKVRTSQNKYDKDFDIRLEQHKDYVNST